MIFGLPFVLGGCSGGSSTAPPGPKPKPLNVSILTPGQMDPGRGIYSIEITLGNGKVLIAGGPAGFASAPDATAQVYDPATGTFSSTANQLVMPTSGAAGTLLADGDVLIVGGRDVTGDVGLTQAELYDPTTNSFTPTTHPLNVARYLPTATALPDGTALIAGGIDAGTGAGISSAEIFNPTTGDFTFTTGSMVTGRGEATAVLLKGGQVLIAGGAENNTPLDTAELYTPSSQTFAATNGPMSSVRLDSAAVPLSDGGALEIGGVGSGVAQILNTIDIYDPTAETFSPSPTTMSEPRQFPYAAALNDGTVLIGGGFTVLFGEPTISADLFNPTGDTIAPTTEPMHIGRAGAQAAVLSDGSVLVLGGSDNQKTNAPNFLADGEIYDPTAQSFTISGGLNSTRVADAAALLQDGRVLIAGGADGGGHILQSAEIFDPSTGLFTPTANMNEPRVSLNAVTLPTGDVLIAGGGTDTQAELFDPTSGTFTPTTGLMTADRDVATATLLKDGTVLIAGGLDINGNSLASAEIYDPASETFTPTSGPMGTPRAIATATLLKNGMVLIAGGSTNATFVDGLDTADLYNPSTKTFSAVANTMSSARVAAAAALLPNGDVLVAGGVNPSKFPTDTADIFDPSTGQFSPVASTMHSPRAFIRAVALKDGRVVLASGGQALNNDTPTVDFYVPSSGQFVAGADVVTQRAYDTTTLLANGKILLAGGNYLSLTTAIGAAVLATAELYTP
jgi:N-acetylneuraminic acid mutarotase